MTKIKTLKNRKTGEQYAPRTHVKAVFDDNGNTLDSLLGVQDEKLSELGSDISILEQSVYGVDLSFKVQGYISSTGIWVNINSNYEFTPIKVFPEDVVVLKAATSSTSIAFLTEYPNPVNNGSVPLSSVEGYNSRIDSNGLDQTFTIPVDTKYIVVWTIKNGGNVTFDKFTINGKNLGGSILDYINDLDKKIEISTAIVRTDGALNKQGLVGIDKTETLQGFVSGEKKWNNINSNNQFSIIRVNQGQIIELKAASSSTSIAFLTEYPNPVNNGSVPLSSVEGYNSRIDSNGNNQEFTVPSDCKYIAVWVKKSGYDATFEKLTRNGENLELWLWDNIVNESVKLMSLISCSRKIGLVDDNYIRSIGIVFQRRLGSTGNVSVSDDYFYTEMITSQQNLKLEFDNTLIRLDRKIIWNGNATSVVGTEAYMVLPGETFQFCFARRSADVDISIENIPNLIKLKGRRESDINWLALGDSIVQGTISDDSSVNKERCWVGIVAAKNNYNLTNRGDGGSGWVMVSPNTNRNIRGLVDLPDTDADYIDFSKYNLITIAIGINDWKTPQDFGTIDDDPYKMDTVYANMKYVIQKISEANPTARLVVISPLNCSVFSGSSFDTKWGLEYDNGDGKTLEDMFELEKSVCDLYGVEFIDMTHNSFVNLLNIKSILLDNVHPSYSGHFNYAMEISKLL